MYNFNFTYILIGFNYYHTTCEYEAMICQAFAQSFPQIENMNKDRRGILVLDWHNTHQKTRMAVPSFVYESETYSANAYSIIPHTHM